MAGSSSRRFEARAARLLAALVSFGGRLVPCEIDGQSAHRLDGAPKIVASGSLVQTMLDRDWLECQGDGFAVSKAGLAWLRRAQAADDPFRAQHQVRETVLLDQPDGSKAQATIVANESPLSWLRRRRGSDGRPLVGEAQFTAGERLRADFERACMGPRVTADWTRPTLGRQRRGPADTLAGLPETALAARTRVEAALRDLGPDLGTLLLDICCFLVGLEDIERRRNWPRRSAKVVLGIALDRLAAHYGLAEAARGRDWTGRILHWGDEDYRPHADAAPTGYSRES